MDIYSVKSAKECIDCLARGIDPVTRESVSDNDVINKIQVARCLLQVSDILQEVIDMDTASKKQAFSTCCIDLNRFELSSDPLTISAITERINLLKPTEMINLKVTALTKWLTDINMLYVKNVNGKNHKYPTEEGLELGIIQEDRRNAHGVEYSLVTYSKQAQQFIIDNLDSVVQGGYNGNTKENAGMPWSDEDDNLLKTMFNEGRKISEIATHFKRSNGAIRSRIKKLELD